MDADLSAAARALAAGDSLAALKRIALREDAAALAMRGIAMAQLGEFARARQLLQRATRRFGRDQRVARARCVVAEAEVALAMREFTASSRGLVAAQAVLRAEGDHANAVQAGLMLARHALLLGRLESATQALAVLNAHEMSPIHNALAALLTAEIALRSLRIADAQAALSRAQAASLVAGVPALRAEIDALHASLAAPAARVLGAGQARAVPLAEAAALLDSGALVIDACRHGIRAAAHWLPLARRPLLFALAETLALASPADVDRNTLIATLFNTRQPDDSHRARLRVEIGRLRALLAPLAAIEATDSGFVLRPHEPRDVWVLAPPIAGEQAALLALLSDGAAWSTSALALALGASQRTVQRALVELESRGEVRAIGRARSQRWLAPTRAGFTTILLLPSAPPSA